MTETTLTEGRWSTIRDEVDTYLRASEFAADFDVDGIVSAVASKCNSVDELSEDEFNAILLANDNTAE